MGSDRSSTWPAIPREQLAQVCGGYHPGSPGHSPGNGLDAVLMHRRGWAGGPFEAVVVPPGLIQSFLAQGWEFAGGTNNPWYGVLFG
jgi:hypothetical protein